MVREIKSANGDLLRITTRQNGITLENVSGKGCRILFLSREEAAAVYECRNRDAIQINKSNGDIFRVSKRKSGLVITRMTRAGGIHQIRVPARAAGLTIDMAKDAYNNIRAGMTAEQRAQEKEREEFMEKLLKRVFH